MKLIRVALLVVAVLSGCVNNSASEPSVLMPWHLPPEPFADDATSFDVVLDHDCGLFDKGRILEPQIEYLDDEIRVAIPIGVMQWGMVVASVCSPADHVTVHLDEPRNGRRLVVADDPS